MRPEAAGSTSTSETSITLQRDAAIVSLAGARAITRTGDRSKQVFSATEAGFGERPARPGEALLVPARELGERHPIPGRVDEPAAAEVDAGVVDLCGLRARAGGAPEEDVSRLQLRKADALGRRYLAAHRKRRSALQRRGEGGAVRVGLKLVDPPDEA